MTLFPIHAETLKTLYDCGFIAPEALTAIAPIAWLAAHYPELLENPEKALEAIKPKTQTCKDCIHFSSIHKCCMTRIDDKTTYLPVNENTQACGDFEGVTLPYFLKSGGHQ